MERPCDFPPIQKLAGGLRFLKKWGGGAPEPRPGGARSSQPLHSAIHRRVDDELVVRSLRRCECVLNEAHRAVVRMIEQAKAAFARLNRLLVPRFGEELALAPQRIEE